MKSSLRGAMLLLGATLLVTACSREQAPAGGETATPAPAASSQAAPGGAAAQAPAIAELKVGRYVDPKTFAVGGVGTTFKTSDKLFAMVRLAGLTGPASVTAKLSDDQGKVLAEQSHDVAPKGAMRANFSLSAGLAAPLAPGHYRVDAQFDGGSPTSADITVE